MKKPQTEIEKLEELHAQIKLDVVYHTQMFNRKTTAPGNASKRYKKLLEAQKREEEIDLKIYRLKNPKTTDEPILKSK